MKNELAIIDTNVVVAGLLTSSDSSPTARILDAMVAGDILFVISVELLAEYRSVLLRPRIQKLHRLTEDETDQLLTEIVANAMVRESTPSAVPAPDKGDEHLWNLMSALQKTILVTGDALLLNATPDLLPEGASVVSPRGFLAILEP